MTIKRKIGIIVFDEVLTSEVIAPAEVFGIARERAWFADWEVIMVGVEKRPLITTAEGIKLGVEATVYDDVLYDVLIVPGAYEMDNLIQNEVLNSFIKRHEEAAKWLSSNCSGAFLLANAGVLDGKRATTWFGGESSLQEQYPEVDVVFDNPVVVDNRRVTSNGGVISYQSALVLLAQLTSNERAYEVYETLSIGRLEPWEQIAAAA